MRIWPYIKKNILYTKIALLGLCSAFITAAVLVTVVVWLTGVYSRQVQNKVDTLINEVLDGVAKGVYNLVKIEDETVVEGIRENLNVARNILTDIGSVSLEKQTLTWDTVNQFTGQRKAMVLPVMRIGDVEIRPQADMKKELPVVDAVTRLVGVSATIFQIMNEEGDMLRIATTVTNKNGTRAIGTYIPAINPDGSTNAVIHTIMNGEMYSGRAYVVNNWYLTAYEPLRDKQGRLVGMLYVGVRQDSASKRIRQAILKTKVGESGYVYVIGGKGAERGRYIVSYRGVRDGENIWDNQDDEGRLVIQSIINKTQSLEPGELATECYWWQNPGEDKPRRKVARLIYYEPWDWVIGTSIYEEELQSYQKELMDGRLGTLYTMGLAALGIMIIVACLGVIIAWRITRPVRDMTHAAELISTGCWDVSVHSESQDEIGVLANAFNLMTAQIKDILDGLQKSEQFLEDIIENIPGMIFVKDARSLRFIRFNKAGEELTGYSRRELIGRTDFEIFPEEEAQFFGAKDKQALREKRLVDIPEETMHNRNRECLVLHTRKLPVCDSNGVPQFLLGISEDITQRKRNEEALRASEQRYRLIVNTANEGVLMLDEISDIVFANARLCEMLGFASEEIVGLSIRQFLYDEDKEDHEKHIRNRHKGESERYERRWKCKDGNPVWTIVAASPLCDEKGHVIGSFAMITDITDRKKMEEEIISHRLHLEELVHQRTAQLMTAKEQAETANKAKSIFLTKMSHELRTPLNAILGYTQIFLNKNTHRDMAKGLRIMQQSGEHLLAMINDILNLAKIEAGKLDLNPQPLSLEQFIDGIMGIIRSRAHAKGLDVLLDVNGALPPGVLADEIRLRQVLLNLLSNAIKFTEEGSITLRVACMPSDRRPDDGEDVQYVRLRFDVRDTGVGIPPDQMSRLFRPFEQISQSPRWIEGTGLGLAISRQLVQLMGSDMVVESEAGHGSTFWFEVLLPLVSVSVNDADVIEQPEQTILGYAGPKKTVLIVDDIESNRAVLVDLLRPIGFDIVEAADGHEAVTLAAKHEPDLILLDHYMPVLNGFEAAVRMRRCPELKKAVIIAVSASVPDHEIENYLPAGYDAFIPKPVHWPTLSTCIAELMSLEWIYAPVPTPAHDAQEERLAQIIVPPSTNVLHELQHLAHLGDLISLKNAAARIKQDSPQYAAFADQLITYAVRFDDQGILALLQSFLKEES